MSRTDFLKGDYVEKHNRNYENAVASEDKNVYFIDGKQLMKIAGDNGTVDGCRPTDLGFFSMTEDISEVLSNILLSNL